VTNKKTNNFKQMKDFKIVIWILLLLPFIGFSQEEPIDSTATEETVVENKLERAAFESSQIIDNNTSVTFVKGTLEIVMQHRFGLVDGGINDVFGLWAPTNIRLAVAYSLTDRITVGVGTTKDSRLQDFNAKIALLRQTRSGSMPVNVTYFGNMVVDARTKDNFNNIQDRYSFFNQLIISRRMSPKISFQMAPSVAHINLVEPTQPNDLFALSLGGRYKISSQTCLLVDYTYPFADYENSPQPGFSVGAEFNTSAHAFQIYFTNYKGIVNQRSQYYNQNNFFEGDFMLGFTITRRYNF
jgi:hypothetical protein